MDGPGTSLHGAPSDGLTNLLRVYGHPWTQEAATPERDYVALEFQFEDAVLVVEAEPEFDECFLHVEGELGRLRCAEASADDGRVDMSGEPWWPPISGASVRWLWVLQNQQGYQDGGQLEFVLGDGEPVILQFVTMASCLRISVVTRLHERERRAGHLGRPAGLTGGSRRGSGRSG